MTIEDCVMRGKGVKSSGRHQVRGLFPLPNCLVDFEPKSHNCRWFILSPFAGLRHDRVSSPHNYFHPQWGFAICNKQRQKFVNDCLRLFASAISTNFIYFFDLRIFPTCVTIQYTGNLYTARIISIKIIIINPSIEIRF